MGHGVDVDVEGESEGAVGHSAVDGVGRRVDHEEMPTQASPGVGVEDRQDHFGQNALVPVQGR
jgi:hypothetical protein